MNPKEQTSGVVSFGASSVKTQHLSGGIFEVLPAVVTGLPDLWKLYNILHQGSIH